MQSLENLSQPALEVAWPVQILPATMTTLPISVSADGDLGAASLRCSSEISKADIANDSGEDEHSLLRAFRTFSGAAASLEQAYGNLRLEVGWLRVELEKSNSGLASSLEENRRIRLHLDRILQALPCGLMVLSRDGKLAKANPEAARLLGIPIEGMQGSGAGIDALPGEVTGWLRCARDSGTEAEIEWAGEAGSNRWLTARHAPIAEDQGGASVFILQDVSQRKQLEQVQQKLRREQALAEISSVLAHEIRNPLGSLELFAGLLADSGLDPERKQWVEHMQAGLRTLGATVNNVLQFHELPGPECVPLDVGTLLDWARLFLGPLATQADVLFTVDHSLSGVSMRADRHRFEQVILNLVLNSIQATPAGGWIRLAGRFDRADRGAVIEVCDTGPGICPQNLPKIFEPGFSTRASSPGLGLAVCRRIIEEFGGHIEAENRPGGGAAFTLSVPAAPATGSGGRL